MFRSSMTLIREVYLFLTKVIFMLKHSVKLRHSIYYVMWQHVVERHVRCVQCSVRFSWVDHERNSRDRNQWTHIEKYSCGNRTVRLWNRSPVEILGTLPCKINAFRKSFVKVINVVNRTKCECVANCR